MTEDQCRNAGLSLDWRVRIRGGRNHFIPRLIVHHILVSIRVHNRSECSLWQSPVSTRAMCSPSMAR